MQGRLPLLLDTSKNPSLAGGVEGSGRRSRASLCGVVSFHAALARVEFGTKGNGLSEADLDVFAKLPEQRLERGEEAEALARGQVVAEDDLLQLGLAQRVEVEVARQVAP